VARQCDERIKQKKCTLTYILSYIHSFFLPEALAAAARSSAAFFSSSVSSPKRSTSSSSSSSAAGACGY